MPNGFAYVKQISSILDYNTIGRKLEENIGIGPKDFIYSREFCTDFLEILGINTSWDGLETSLCPHFVLGNSYISDVCNLH